MYIRAWLLLLQCKFFLNHLACDYCEFFCIVIIIIDLPLLHVKRTAWKNLVFVTADVASILCDGVQLASDIAC